MRCDEMEGYDQDKRVKMGMKTNVKRREARSQSARTNVGKKE